MRAVCLWVMMCAPCLLFAQTVPVEVVFGNKHYWYQHMISRPINNSMWGFFNTSSLEVFYDKKQPAELMSQSYLTFALFKQLKLGAGSFYASAPGFKPSVHIQLSQQGKNYFVVMVPRMDVDKNPSYDAMLMAEYKPTITSSLKLYTRFQGMMNFTGTTHNRSYQSFRGGVDLGYMQVGLAAHFDAYGADIDYKNNVGVFVKKDLF